MVWFISVIVILLLILLIYSTGHIFYELVLQNRVDKEFFTGPFVMDPQWQNQEALFSQYDPQDVYYTNPQGLKLHAVKVVRDPNKWVIIMHGYMGRSLEMVDIALQCLAQNYSVLIPDQRAHSKSEGRKISMGFWESEDLKAWIQEVVKEYPESKIYLIGVSMGAATVMMACESKLPANVVCAVEDCGYTSAWEEFGYQLKSIFKMPKFPFLYMADLATRTRGNYPLKGANPLEAIKKTSIPFMFIHGGKDTLVPTHMVYKLYEAASYPKRLEVIENAEHALARKRDPRRYYQAIFEWFDSQTS